MQFSICIPTFNRVDNLNNCLNSILISDKLQNDFNYEICISDNGSTEKVEKIVDFYKSKLKIKFHKFEKNMGFALNALKTVDMAEGEFVWMIGNDDLLLPESLSKIKKLLSNNKEPEYFFINSFHLNSNFLKEFPRPFDTKNLPINKLKSISKVKSSKQVEFWEIIDPEVSWDFLIGIYLSIFKREKWNKHKSILNYQDLNDARYWSNFNNTCIHPIIMGSAFKNSKAFICAEPLSVNLSGQREWSKLYEFIEIIRLPELLDYYRNQGMSLKRYLYNKNYSLRNFSNYFFKILIRGEEYGRNYINFKKHIIPNLFYPNVYLSIIKSLFRINLKIIKKLIK
jgi:glycosyltransferase involved in cell wall biosynthesis|tara:strand:- start:3377 stop:4396 length:1020 start_codon:yes stop_codon:yes gene_type:complete